MTVNRKRVSEYLFNFGGKPYNRLPDISVGSNKFNIKFNTKFNKPESL